MLFLISGPSSHLQLFASLTPARPSSVNSNITSIIPYTTSSSPICLLIIWPFLSQDYDFILRFCLPTPWRQGLCQFYSPLFNQYLEQYQEDTGKAKYIMKYVNVFIPKQIKQLNKRICSYWQKPLRKHFGTLPPKSLFFGSYSSQTPRYT